MCFCGVQCSVLDRKFCRIWCNSVLLLIIIVWVFIQLSCRSWFCVVMLNLCVRVFSSGEIVKVCICSCNVFDFSCEIFSRLLRIVFCVVNVVLIWFVVCCCVGLFSLLCSIEMNMCVVLSGCSRLCIVEVMKWVLQWLVCLVLWCVLFRLWVCLVMWCFSVLVSECSLCVVFLQLVMLVQLVMKLLLGSGLSWIFSIVLLFFLFLCICGWLLCRWFRWCLMVLFIGLGLSRLWCVLKWNSFLIGWLMCIRFMGKWNSFRQCEFYVIRCSFWLIIIIFCGRCLRLWLRLLLVLVVVCSRLFCVVCSFCVCCLSRVFSLWWLCR